MLSELRTGVAVQGTGMSWADSDSQLVMLLSSERSGSTLLRVILGQHSRIVAPAELWLMYYCDYDAWREHRSVAVESVVEYFDLIGETKSEADLDAACRGLSTADVYRWMLSHLDSHLCLVDKTPAYSNSIRTLARSIEFNPFYIWLVRHPMGVVNSHVRLYRSRTRLEGVRLLARKLFDRAEQMLCRGMTRAARRREAKWVAQNLNIRNFLSAVPKNQRSAIRFEDLVAEPQACLGDLTEHIGLAFESKMLDPCSDSDSVSMGIGDPTFGEHRGIDPTVAERWREEFSEDSLQSRTRKLLQEIWTDLAG